MKTGSKHSSSAKEKMRKAKIGTVATEETKRRMSESQKRIGNVPPSNKGKHHKPETIEKIRISNLGNKSVLWRGGKTALTSLVRESYKYHEWRKGVYTRDNYTCQFCGQVGGRLQADHIVPFCVLMDCLLKEHNAKELNKYKQLELAIGYEKLWDINNGRTLCIGCHRTTDTYGKKARLNKLTK